VMQQAAHKAMETTQAASTPNSNLAGGRPDQDGRASAASTGVALVPRGGFFEGQIAILGQTRIEGTVRGSLRGAGELVLGREARVEGVVECDAFSSRGEMIGPVVAHTRAHLGEGAHLEGDLEGPAVEVDDGVIWNGVARIGI
jgi:cytoskeletal protein CcmA (bactofilin family)